MLLADAAFAAPAKASRLHKPRPNVFERAVARLVIYPRVGTAALDNAFAGLGRDRPLHKIHQDQGNHRRCNDDVSQPVEVQDGAVGALRDKNIGYRRGDVPPANCCSDELMALKAPRLVTSGIAVISAWDGIMREKMPTNSSTLMTITTANGVGPRLVQITTMTMETMVPNRKTVNLPKRSLARPTSGPTKTVHTPVTR